MRWRLIQAMDLGRLRARSEQGQMAVAFIVLMALILVLASMTMNLGEVSRIKTSTANVADAGALAGASWVASGENDAAMIARAMWLNILLVQAFFYAPFCLSGVMYAFAIMAALLVTNQFLKSIADDILHGAWDNAKAAAVLTALANADIDDDTGNVSDQLKLLQDEFKEEQDFPSIRIAGSEDGPSTYRVPELSWTRRGADGKERESRFNLEVEFTGSRPELDLGGFGLIFWCWCIPCFCIYAYCCCWALEGWTGWEDDTTEQPSQPTAKQSGGAGPSSWGGFLGRINFGSFIEAIPHPEWGGCGQCYIPIIVYVPGDGWSPDEITHDQADVMVRVSQHRNVAGDGTRLGFWRMRYPGPILSDSTAHYRKASVGLWPNPRAEARLTTVH